MTVKEYFERIKNLKEYTDEDAIQDEIRWEKQQKEREMQRYKQNMYTNGYQTTDLSFFDTDEFKDLLETLNSVNIEEPNYQETSLSIEEVKDQSNNIITSHVTSNIPLLYANVKNLKKQLIAKFGKNPNPDQMDEIIAFILKNTEAKNIEQIPIRHYPKYSKGGCVFYSQLYENFPNLDYYKKTPQIIDHICLNGELDNSTICINNHETYHALSRSHKGFAKNSLNDETLPIFIEQVTASDLQDEQLRQYMLLTRLYDLKEKCNRYDKAYNKNEYTDPNIEQYTKYSLSTIYGLALFDTYENANDLTKQSIDHDITDIFLGKGTVEDLLKEYNITNEKATDNAKTLIKKVK